MNKSINYLQLSMHVYVCTLQLLNNVISEASASITFNYFSPWCVGSRCCDNSAIPGAQRTPWGHSAGGQEWGRGAQPSPGTPLFCCPLWSPHCMARFHPPLCATGGTLVKPPGPVLHQQSMALARDPVEALCGPSREPAPPRSKAAVRDQWAGGGRASRAASTPSEVAPGCGSGESSSRGARPHLGKGTLAGL